MRDVAADSFGSRFHCLDVPFTRPGLRQLQDMCAVDSICKHVSRIQFTLPTPILAQEFRSFGSSHSQNAAIQHALENTGEPGQAFMAGAGSVERLAFHLQESTSIHAMMWNGEAVLTLAASFQRTLKLKSVHLHEGGALANCLASLPSSPAAAIVTALAHAGVKLHSFYMVYHGQYAHPHGISIFDVPARMSQIGQQLRQLDISVTASVSGQHRQLDLSNFADSYSSSESVPPHPSIRSTAARNIPTPVNQTHVCRHASVPAHL